MENNNISPIALIDEQGNKISKLSLGCSWGMHTTDTKITVVDDNGFYGIGRKTHKENQKLAVDLDLSCIFFNQDGEICDNIYSTKFKHSMLDKHHLPYGKFEAQNGGFHHTGDDLQGDKDQSHIELDNESILMDLSVIDPSVSQIFFFINNSGHGELSKLPYVKIRLNNTTEQNVIWSIDASKLPQSKGKNTFIIGKLTHLNGHWDFFPIEKAYKDEGICVTIDRIRNLITK